MPGKNSAALARSGSAPGSGTMDSPSRPLRVAYGRFQVGGSGRRGGAIVEPDPDERQVASVLHGGRQRAE